MQRKVKHKPFSQIIPSMNASAPSFVPPGVATQKRSAVTGRTGEKKVKQKPQQANHLASFHSTKPLHLNKHEGNRQQKHNRTYKKHQLVTTPHHSKEHFLATNYRYVVSSSANFMQTGFFDPDEMVAWDDIHLVIATLDEDSAVESCAICLEETIVLPQLTKCGHIFCLTCLLRYLETEFSKKCPVCSRCDVNRSDLRDVMFVVTPPPLLKSNATFSLLSKDKASLFPICHDPHSRSLLASPQVQDHLVSKKEENAQFENEQFLEASAVGIPEIDSSDSQYSRVCFASPQKLVRFVNQSLKTLENFRKVCVSSGSSQYSAESRGDVEYVAFLPEASALLTARKDRIKSALDESCGAMKRAAPRAVAGATLSPTSDPSCLWLYQEQSGHMSFLHPLCVRALLHQQALTQEEEQMEELKAHSPIELSAPSCVAPFVSGLPCQVSGRVLEVDALTVTPEQRRRYPFTRHLPLDCVFSLVEIDMRGVLSPTIYEHFRGQFKQREADRKTRRSRQVKEDKRYKKRVESKEEKIIASRREVLHHREEAERDAIQSLLSGPMVGSQGLTQEQQEEATVIEDIQSHGSNSFANITQLGVSNDKAFPVLGGGAGSRPVVAAKSAWGATEVVSDVSSISITPAVNSSKKRGKNKFGSKSSLLSTSGGRSYR